MVSHCLSNKKRLPPRYRVSSNSYSLVKEFNKALDFTQQALKKAQRDGKPEYEAQALLKLAFLYRNDFNDFPKAIELAQQALAIAKKIPNRELEAKALQVLRQRKKVWKYHAKSATILEK